MIAVCHQNTSSDSGALIQHTFADGCYSDFVTHTSKETLDSDDILIYSSLEKEDIYPAAKSEYLPDGLLQITSLPHIVRDKQPDCNILLIGNAKKCCGVIEQLKGRKNLVYSAVTECAIDEHFPHYQSIIQIPDLLDFNVLDTHLGDKTDAVIILATTPDAREIRIDHDHGEMDARTLLIAQHISSNSRKDHKIRIIAEMIGRNSRELFKNAGVDVVLPSNLAVERMMTKMAYGYGAVSNYLMAALALNDSAHLDSIVLKERDSAWLNLNYEELLLGMPEQMHLLAVYPADTRMQKTLFNELQDFGRHYISNSAHGAAMHYVSQTGDTLLVLNSTSSEN